MNELLERMLKEIETEIEKLNEVTSNLSARGIDSPPDELILHGLRSQKGIIEEIQMVIDADKTWEEIADRPLIGVIKY